MNLVITVDLAPALLVLHVDVLRAEDPTESDWCSVGEGCRVVLRPEVEVGTRADAVQRVSRTRARARIRLRHVLGGRLAVALGRANLAEEVQGFIGTPLAIEIDEP